MFRQLLPIVALLALIATHAQPASAQAASRAAAKADVRHGQLEHGLGGRVRRAARYRRQDRRPDHRVPARRTGRSRKSRN